MIPAAWEQLPEIPLWRQPDVDATNPPPASESGRPTGPLERMTNLRLEGLIGRKRDAGRRHGCYGTMWISL